MKGIFFQHKAPFNWTLQNDIVYSYKKIERCEPIWRVIHHKWILLDVIDDAIWQIRMH